MVSILSVPSLRSKPIYERKFVLPASLAPRVLAWARENMMPDPNGGLDGYTVTSLYLDTKDMAVLRKQGSFGRAKYRIRRYNDEGVICLERKMKRDGVVAKRRTFAHIS